jgi:hypothetical protein
MLALYRIYRTDVVTTFQPEERPLSPMNTGDAAVFRRDYRGNFGLGPGTE